MKTLILLTLATLMGTAAWTQAGDAVSDSGQAFYIRYCGACHGPKGEGDGVASVGLLPKPANLTRLAARNGGVFAAAQISAFIDGTQPLAIHGSSAMPVWGEILRAEESPDVNAHAAVRGKLMLITEYLRSIQAK
jgi:mono/diheme cytochrome c family protein